MKKERPRKALLPFSPPHRDLHLLLAGFVLLLISGGYFLLKLVPTFQGRRIEGQSVLRTKPLWDFMVAGDQADRYHAIRVLPEGLSVAIYDIATNTARQQINFFNIPSHQDSTRPARFLSASFGSPADVNNDGQLEGIISANDSTGSYLIWYDTTGTANKFYSVAAHSLAPGKIWDGTLEVRGAADFGDGLRLIVTKIPRYVPEPREVLIMDPQDGRVEVSWEMGAVPEGRFGLLPPCSPKKTGFYLTTNCTENGRVAGDLADTLGYLLVFSHTPTGWKMQSPYIVDLSLGKALDAQPLNLPRGKAWLISVGDSCFAIDEQGGRLSSALYSRYAGLCIEGVFDSNHDGFSDAAILTDQRQIILLKLREDGSFRVAKSWASPTQIQAFGFGKRLIINGDCDRGYLLVAVSIEKTMTFLNMDLDRVGEMPRPDIILPAAPSPTRHGRAWRALLLARGIWEGTILWGTYDNVVVTEFHPVMNRTAFGGALMALTFLGGLGLTGFLSLRAVLKLKQKERAEAERERIFHLAVRAFRRKPSDVTLYMEHFFGDRWGEVQKKVEEGAKDALERLALPVPHDSIRAEIGLPQTGEERLVNLLILRRATLHFLAQGIKGNALIAKLNFDLEPQYVRLIQEAQVILKQISRELKSGGQIRLNEAHVRDELRELEKARQISGDPAPRKLFGDVRRDDAGQFQGSLRLTQGGKQIQLIVNNGLISYTYHSNLSPTFAEFLAAIGLSAEIDLPEQVLFPEEEAYLGTIQ